MSAESNSKTNGDLVEQLTARSTAFVKSREDWFTSSILANYSRSDKEVLQIVLNNWKNAIDANIGYHKEMAKVMEDESPVIARQHRLLAAIYSEIRPTLNSG